MTPGIDKFYKKRSHLSISSLLSFARCPRKYFYSSGCRLQSLDGPHPALMFGSAMHNALPELLQGEEATKMDRAIAKFRAIFTEEIDTLSNDSKRNISRAKAMLYDFYCSHSASGSLYQLVPPPAARLKIEDEVSDWEVPFALDIGLSVPLVGRIDALVRHRDTKRLWGLEWKTSSELSTRFIQSFQNSPQVIAYTLALRIFTSEPVEGIMVEGIRVSPKNCETMLMPISVPDFKVDAFIKWARYNGNMLLECERLGEFPQFLSGCNPYSMFGSPGYDCDFAALCSVPDWTQLKGLYAVGDDRPFVLKAVDGDDNPVKRVALPVVQ